MLINKFIYKRFTFYTNLLILFSSIVFAIFFKFLGLESLFYHSLIPISLFLLSLSLCYVNTTFAQIVFLISVNTALIYFSVLLGKESAIYLLFIVIPILPLIYFETNKILRFTFTTASILSYLMTEILMTSENYPIFRLDKYNIEFIGIFAVTLIIIINIITVFTLLYLKYQFKTQLIDSNESLIKVNKMLTESKKMQFELTQYADYAKLVQRIAHEFKNPLQMLQGTAEVGLKKDNQAELFKIVLQSVDRLNYVIQPMLNYLNTEENYHFDSFDISKIVDDIVILSKANCNSKKIKISVQNILKNSMVFGDSKAIGQIFINLITNSIDAIGSDGGRIIIDLINQSYFHNSKERDGIKIDIIDNGCGIDENQLKKIFVPYETSKKSKNNVGLGLSIVSKIIEDHNGLIKISSLKGEGTTISIFFPIGDANTVIVKNETSFLLDDEFFQI